MFDAVIMQFGSCMDENWRQCAQYTKKLHTKGSKQHNDICQIKCAFRSPCKASGMQTDCVSPANRTIANTANTLKFKCPIQNAVTEWYSCIPSKQNTCLNFLCTSTTDVLLINTIPAYNCCFTGQIYILTVLLTGIY